MSAPGYIEIILSWSSSFTHTKNVLSLLWKMPLPDGQSLLRPHDSRNLSPSLNKKWSSINCFLSSSVIDPRAKYVPSSSPVKDLQAVLTNSSTLSLYSFEIPGPNGKSAKFLPTLILVETIIAASSSSNGGQTNDV